MNRMKQNGEYTNMLYTRLTGHDTTIGVLTQGILLFPEVMYAGGETWYVSVSEVNTARRSFVS